MERTIFTKDESLKKIQGWNFMPGKNGQHDGKVYPIVLTLPQMTISELDALKRRHAAACDIDGDALPGNATLRVFSETMARELIESYGSKLVKSDSFRFDSTF